jgi:hypothetical protein
MRTITACVQLKKENTGRGSQGDWRQDELIGGKPLRRELKESLETAVEDDWERMARKELGRGKKTSCVLQLQ